MKKFAEQFKKRAEKVHLRASERDELRARLLSYMEYHPLPEGLRNVASGKRRSRKIALPIWQDSWVIGRLVGGVAVLLLIVVPTLAEDALPGDTLYPIKVRFNEELRGAMNSSPYQKVEWETERLERRLAEAELLADSGRLTPDAEAKVVSAIKQHSEAAKAGIESIRQSDSDDATLAQISLSSALEVSAEIWTNRDEMSGSASSLTNAVSAARLSIGSSSEQVSYAKLQSRVEGETTRAYEYLHSLKGVTASEKSDIERRLVDVRLKVEAAAKLKSEDEAGANILLTEALSSTRKIISFITNLDVRRNVSLEELVPIAHTEEEKIAAVKQKLTDSDLLIVEVEAGLALLKNNSNDYEAIKATLDQYENLVLETNESLNTSNLAEAEVQAATALELAEALKQTMIGLGLVIAPSTNATSTPSN